MIFKRYFFIPKFYSKYYAFPWPINYHIAEKYFRVPFPEAAVHFRRIISCEMKKGHLRQKVEADLHWWLMIPGSVLRSTSIGQTNISISLSIPNENMKKADCRYLWWNLQSFSLSHFIFNNKMIFHDHAHNILYLR